MFGPMKIMMMIVDGKVKFVFKFVLQICVVCGLEYFCPVDRKKKKG